MKKQNGTIGMTSTADTPSSIIKHSKIPSLWTACFAITILLASCSSTRFKQSIPVVGKGQAILPDLMADPYEPVNRGLWAVNHGLMVGIMQPSGRVYRTLVPPPIRQLIVNFTRNITYPGRLVNNLLQGRWSGAGDESLRFAYNTTAGIGGLFDVASEWKVPKSEANFCQTFYRWGWKPNSFVMLPLLGPSDDSHAFGLIADKASEPWNYDYPYLFGSYTSAYNKLSQTSDEATRFIKSEPDPYVGTKYIWTYAAKEEPPDWRTHGPKDAPSLQTMAVASITCRNPEFPNQGRELSVRLPSTGKNIKYNLWLQPGNAPLAYIAPGLASHRLSANTLSIAENLYQNGFSVVTTTGVFHPEFMENASTSELPAYPPSDSHDLLVELTAIDQALEKKHHGMLGKRALVGFSMGGFYASHIAMREKSEDPGLLRFDRYVAINPPVNLSHGATSVDNYFKSPLEWSSGERQSRIDNSIHKAASLQSLPASYDSSPMALPFDGIESKFLVGLTFRVILRDVIFSSQTRHDMGQLQTPLSKWRRDASYQEILGLSFRDYFLRFVLPYYKTKGIGIHDFAREANLMSFESALHAQKKLNVVTNRNDFLLTPADAAWLQSTFGTSRLKLFPSGGHLGNLATPEVQKAVLAALHGMQ